jgi:outer membrane protein insertion porin family
LVSDGDIVQIETPCPVYDYTPVFDPLYPALVPSPTAPDFFPSGWMIADGETFQRYWAIVDPIEPASLPVVPIITLSTPTEGRTIRVGIWAGDALVTEQCDPLFAGRYLCDAIGKRLSSILGLSLIYDTLDNRVRPSRGETASINFDFAGLGGDVKYARVSAKAAKYFALGKGFIFSLTGEGGAIRGLGGDDVRLTDRFFLGEPQIRGFGIRGVGPRVLRKFITGGVVATKRSEWTDDALGGKYYYMGRAELEIPLGSGARELGLRPSIFLDAGAVWGVRQPQLTQCQTGCIPTYYPRNADGSVNKNTSTTSPVDATTGLPNEATGGFQYTFVEDFVGDTWKPRVAVGVGVNWNSPFGPFRIDFSRVLLKQDGDKTKSFTFNVGTQF